VGGSLQRQDGAGNWTVVAQGVETREQAEFLRMHACDELQGFYFEKPLPAEAFSQLLQEQSTGATSAGKSLAPWVS